MKFFSDDESFVKFFRPIMYTLSMLWHSMSVEACSVAFHERGSWCRASLRCVSGCLDALCCVEIIFGRMCVIFVTLCVCACVCVCMSCV